MVASRISCRRRALDATARGMQLTRDGENDIQLRECRRYQAREQCLPFVRPARSQPTSNCTEWDRARADCMYPWTTPHAAAHVLLTSSCTSVITQPQHETQLRSILANSGGTRKANRLQEALELIRLSCFLRTSIRWCSVPSTFATTLSQSMVQESLPAKLPAMGPLGKESRCEHRCMPIRGLPVPKSQQIGQTSSIAESISVSQNYPYSHKISHL